MRKKSQPAAAAQLGRELIALRLEEGAAAPSGCYIVTLGRDGQPQRTARAMGELAWGVHPGPYACELLPFAAAPELGLRLEFAIDAAGPRRSPHRFDLFLSGEVESGLRELTLPAFAAAAAHALQLALQQGVLELPPCTMVGEWQAFRGGLDELMYTRFGVTLEDCIPVDLAPATDYAAQLRVQQQANPQPPAQPVPDSAARVPPASAAPLPDARAKAGSAFTPVAAGATPPAPAHALPQIPDAAALRRLFLELPALSAGLRALDLPSDSFAHQQLWLQRLALAALDAGAMPSLAYQAPGVARPSASQAELAAHSRRAAAALDEAWALLAAWRRADPATVGALEDDTDRILSNLEQAISQRRAVEEGAAR